MDKKDLEKLLRSRSLRVTSARMDLLVKMKEFDTAMPYSAIQEAFESVDRVTLYRTLESLKQRGIIHKAFQENNEVYYAICGDTCDKGSHFHDHFHFKCVECDSVSCMESTKSIEIAIPNYDIKKIEIQVEGICKACKQAAA